MRVGDAIRCALEDLGEHKLRSGLTMLGMMFGVGAVIAMLSIGAGAEQQALELIDQLGVRNVVIRARTFDTEELKEIRKQSAGLSERDIVAMKEAIPNLEIVAPRALLSPFNVRSAHGKSEAKIYGVGQHHAKLSNLVLAEGRFFDSLDERTHAQVAVLGVSARRDLFGAKAAIGQYITVDGQWLEVIGVSADLAPTSSSVEGVQLSTASNAIYLPYPTLLRKFDHDPLASPLDEIVLRLTPAGSPSDTAVVAKTLLDRLHSGVKDYDLVVPEALLRQSQQTQNIFNIVMGCIAGISLFVGGIGIMNIMLASVLEQTREIGIRRAVGARRRDVRFQFLVSAFALSVLGGLIGIAVGITIAKVVAAYAGWPTLVTVSSIVVSTGVSVIVGLLSGLYPAIRAARLEPIEALHHE
ncbi:MAG: FtsX-like permease family protein [Myxococcales bacterium]|nr:FtsX-like permease family protein [Myxococcales bacterium]